MKSEGPEDCRKFNTYIKNTHYIEQTNYPLPKLQEIDPNQQKQLMMNSKKKSKQTNYTRPQQSFSIKLIEQIGENRYVRIR